MRVSWFPFRIAQDVTPPSSKVYHITDTSRRETRDCDGGSVA